MATDEAAPMNRGEQVTPQEHIKKNLPLVERIKKGGGIARYVEGLGHEAREAFDQRPRACICSDGRIDAMSAIREPAVRLPGVIALEDEARWDEIARLCREAGITDFYSHDDCGAARAAASGIEANLNVNKYAQELVRKFCKKYGFNFKGHIGKESMGTSGAEHPELCLYYDMTGRFEQAMLKDSLPQGFALSASLTPDPLPRMLTLLGIAFGNHGAFGPHGAMRGKGKFTIYVIEKNRVQMNLTKSYIKRAIYNMSPQKYLWIR